MASTWGNSWGVSWGVSWDIPDDVSPQTGGGGVIVRYRDYDRERETPDERRSRIFAEMVDDLEQIEVKQPDEPRKQQAAVAKVIKAVGKFARQEPEPNIWAIQYEQFLTALRKSQQVAQEQQAIERQAALEIAYGIELAMAAKLRNEQALIALLFAD